MTEPAWIRMLETVAEIRHRTDELEYLVIAVLREQGRSWDAIGLHLGITRQAARSRFQRARRRRGS